MLKILRNIGIGCTSTYLKASSQVVASGLKPLASAVAGEKKMVSKPKMKIFPKHSLRNVLSNANMCVASGLTRSFQIRFGHTDIIVPDFTEYRRDSTKSPNSRDTDEMRKAVTSTNVAVGCVAVAYGTKATIIHYVSCLGASADVLALAKIEINLSEIPLGKSTTFKWRGKPLFVKHRTPKEIATEQAVDISSLRDPEADSDRVQKPEWLVVIGVCPHLGCVPMADAGDFGGYYCPCHGSHFDSSGRIRKGPSPTNMEIPHYVFIDDNTVVVG